MEARPNKCWSVSLATKYFDTLSSSVTDVKAGCHRFDPDLTIAGQPLQYLDDGDSVISGAPQTFMVRRKLPTQQLSFHPNLTNGFNLSKTKLYQTLQDCGFKYQHFIIPKLSWRLTSLDLTLTLLNDSRRRQQST